MRPQLRFSLQNRCDCPNRCRGVIAAQQIPPQLRRVDRVERHAALRNRPGDSRPQREVPPLMAKTRHSSSKTDRSWRKPATHGHVRVSPSWVVRSLRLPRAWAD